MLKNSFIKRILFVEIILVSSMTLAFSIASIYSWTLLVGFIIGAFVTIISFLLNTFTAQILLSKKRTRKKANFLGMVRATFQMIWYVLWIILVIYIDSIYSGHSFGHGGTKSLFKPVHFITFIVGMSTIVFSIFISHITIRIKRKESVHG